MSDSARDGTAHARAGWGPALRAARQARHVSLRGLQALVSYDFTYLGQVERGEKPGSRELAARCDAALETGGTLTAAYEAGAGAPPASPAAPSAPSAAPSAAPPVPLLRPATGPESCSGACVAAAADRLCVAGADGCRIVPSAGSYGRLLAENRHDLARPRTGRDRARLLGVRGDLALLAGRAALLDQRDPVRARGYLTMARETAAELGSDARAAVATAHLAVVAATEDQPGVAASYLGSARRHAQRTGVALLDAWLAGLRTEGLRGVGGRAAAALEEAGAALERPCTARGAHDAHRGDCPETARRTH